MRSRVVGPGQRGRLRKVRVRVVNDPHFSWADFYFLYISRGNLRRNGGLSFKFFFSSMATAGLRLRLLEKFWGQSTTRNLRSQGSMM